MQVSFIIPLFNCLALTQECLRTLQATVPAGLSHEVILVDDGSTDGTREWLAGLRPLKGLPGLSLPAVSTSDPSLGPVSPCRVLLNEHNLGFAATCNRGAAEAQGECLFFLNNDLVFQPGWFKPMLDLVQSRDAGLVGNIQLNATTGAVDHAGLWFNRKGKPEHTTKLSWWARLTGAGEVPALTGACFAIKKSQWRQLGGFDEAFVNGGEDVDLCLKARQAGLHNSISTRSMIRHHVSQAPGRKLRDEENSRRLLANWRSVIAELSARELCSACLEVAWEDPRNYFDQMLARDAFLYLCRLHPHPTVRLAGAIQAAFEIEFYRWSHLLDGGPVPPPSETVARQLHRAPPDRTAVI